MIELPYIAITMGDPAGVGPEIILKALQAGEIYRVCRPIVLGDIHVLKAVSRVLDLKPSFKIISEPSEVGMEGREVNIMPISTLEPGSVVAGCPTVAGGRAMVDYILAAAQLTIDGSVSAMVTCPISKELMHRAGHLFDGHTELLAHLTETKDFVMMLAGEKLRVSLVTIHCALRDVPLKLRKEEILKTITITHLALERDFGITQPRLAVAALNPHAGESGLFGFEDRDVVLPAIEEAGNQGIIAEGPCPPDTVFYRAAKGEFDAVVAMYHDQGLIPLKLLHFSDAVNITLGLPIIRTSVDHGTAYNIAGKGIADAASLTAAIKMAVEIVRHRKM